MLLNLVTEYGVYEGLDIVFDFLEAQSRLTSQKMPDDCTSDILPSKTDDFQSFVSEKHPIGNGFYQLNSSTEHLWA